MLPSSDVKKIKIHITTYSNKKKSQQKEIQEHEATQTVMCEDLPKRSFICSLCLNEQFEDDKSTEDDNGKKVKYRACPFCRKGGTFIRDAVTCTDSKLITFDDDVCKPRCCNQTDANPVQSDEKKKKIVNRTRSKTKHERNEEAFDNFNKNGTWKRNKDELRPGNNIKTEKEVKEEFNNIDEIKTERQTWKRNKDELRPGNIKTEKEVKEEFNNIDEIKTERKSWKRNKNELRPGNNIKTEKEVKEEFNNIDEIKTERQTVDESGTVNKTRSRRQSKEDFDTVNKIPPEEKRIKEELPTVNNIKTEKQIKEEFSNGKNYKELNDMNQIKIENQIKEEFSTKEKAENFTEEDNNVGIFDRFFEDNICEKTNTCCRYEHKKEKQCCRYEHFNSRVSGRVVETQTSKPQIDEPGLSLLNQVLTVFKSKKTDPHRSELNSDFKDASIQVSEDRKKNTKSLSVSKLANYSINDNDPPRDQSEFLILESRQPDKNKSNSFEHLPKHKSSSIPQMKLEELKHSIKQRKHSKDTVQEVNRMFAIVGKFEKESKDDTNRPMIRSGPRILPVVKTEVRPNAREVKDNYSEISGKILSQDTKYSFRETKDNYSEISDSQRLEYQKCGKTCQTSDYYMSGGDSKDSVNNSIDEKKCNKCVYMLSCRHNANQAGMLICECCRKRNRGCSCSREDCCRREEF